MDDLSKPIPPELPNTVNDSLPMSPKAATLPAGPTTPDKLPAGGPSKSLLFGVLAAFLVLAAGGVIAWWVNSHSAVKTAKPVVDPKKDIAIIRYAVVDDNTSGFAPNFPEAVISTVIDRQVFETLVAFTGRNKLSPVLAKSWTNTDDNTWVFKLKPGVKFHTGRTMEASDIKASIEALQKIAAYAVFTGTIKSVDVVDSGTVKIVTKQPDAVLLNRLSFLFIFDTTSGKTNDAVNGTGPYILKPGTKLESKRVELVAYDGYHGGHVYARELVFQSLEYSDEKIKAIKDGGFELSSGMNDAVASDLVKSVPGSKLEVFDTDSVFSLMLNTLKGPLTKLQLRQALMYAIDPQKLITASGISATVASQSVAASVPGYNPDIKRPALDIAKAKQLVIDAGYPKGLSLNINYAASQKKYIDELTTELAVVGITLTTKLLDNKTFFATIQGENAGDLALVAFNSDINDYSDIVSAQLQYGHVYKLYKNPEIDKLQAESNSIFEAGKRLAKLQEIAKIASEDLPLIPIRIRIGKGYVASSSYVYKLDFPGNNLMGINFWQMYQK